MRPDYIRRFRNGQRAAALPAKPWIGYELQTMTERGKPSAEEIRVTVKVFGGLRELMDETATSLAVRSRATPDEVLDRLHASHPRAAEALRDGVHSGYLNLLINGQIIPPSQRASIALQNGDVIAFLPPVGGG